MPDMADYGIHETAAFQPPLPINPVAMPVEEYLCEHLTPQIGNTVTVWYWSETWATRNIRGYKLVWRSIWGAGASSGTSRYTRSFGFKSPRSGTPFRTSAYTRFRTSKEDTLPSRRYCGSKSFRKTI